MSWLREWAQWSCVCVCARSGKLWTPLMVSVLIPVGWILPTEVLMGMLPRKPTLNPPCNMSMRSSQMLFLNLALHWMQEHGSLIVGLPPLIQNTHISDSFIHWVVKKWNCPVPTLPLFYNGAAKILIDQLSPPTSERPQTQLHLPEKEQKLNTGSYYTYSTCPELAYSFPSFHNGPENRNHC